MENNDTRYKTLMANLQNIDNGDSSLYTPMDSEKFFDVVKQFGESTYEKIYNNFDFSVVLTDENHKQMTQKVSEAKNKHEIIAIYKEYDKRIDDNAIFKMLSTNFEKAQKALVSQLNAELQKSILKWKKIINAAQNTNIETNIWPLHIGFFFISIKTEKKSIFAPLFFKEVTVEVRNSLVYLHSNSEVRVNSKLITYLSQDGFIINADNYDFSNKSIKQVYEFFKQEWSPIYNIPETLKTPIPDLTQNKILNTSIEFHPGMVLGFYSVSSGFLWNVMKKIIDNDEFDSILQPSIIKTKYHDNVIKKIFEDQIKLFKVQKTNYSQDLATISSLIQDTVVWGPPGTGKSQTITNLIINIIARGKTALVVSQKKAALDVLKNRLKSLSIFCLFVLNDKNLHSDYFYKPLQKFIYELEHFKNSRNNEPMRIFTEQDKNYVDIVKELKNWPNLNNLLPFYAALKGRDLKEEDYNALKTLDHNLKFEFNQPIWDKKEIRKHLYTINNNKKPTIFSTYSKPMKFAADQLSSHSNLFNIDIDEAVKYVDEVEYEDYLSFDSKFKQLIKAKTIDINDDQVLKEMIMAIIVEKVKNFNEKQIKQYTAFASNIRNGIMRPYKFIHNNIEMIKMLFPIIVTTPEIDLSMWDKGEFDYAIVDESSQIFVEKAIPILYLAKRKVLAGDSQQMQPTRWFSVSYSYDEDDDFSAMKSILEYANSRGVYSVLLDKNYRSKQAALMTFSSKHFYESKLDVIDDYELSIKNEKAIEVVQVEGTWDNSMNEAEGLAVIKIVKEKLPVYNKIIVLVFNSKQQDYLLNFIFDGSNIDLEEAIGSGRLVLKNIENIQGDEADLVIMSVVYDKNTTLSQTYVARQGGKNALNVAVSRAREKIIVVKSIYAADVEISERSTSDMILFKEWLKFLDLSLIEQKNYLDDKNKNKAEINLTKTISLSTDLELNKEIGEAIGSLLLNKKDFEVITNYSVGTKNIDIALVNKLTNKIVSAFIIDNFDYENNYEEYLVFEDGVKFIKSKTYPIKVVSRLTWPIQKANILKEINDKLIQQEKHNEELRVNLQPKEEAVIENNIVAENSEIVVLEEKEITEEIIPSKELLKEEAKTENIIENKQEVQEIISNSTVEISENNNENTEDFELFEEDEKVEEVKELALKKSQEIDSLKFNQSDLNNLDEVEEESDFLRQNQQDEEKTISDYIDQKEEEDIIQPISPESDVIDTFDEDEHDPSNSQEEQDLKAEDQKNIDLIHTFEGKKYVEMEDEDDEVLEDNSIEITYDNFETIELTREDLVSNDLEEKEVKDLSLETISSSQPVNEDIDFVEDQKEDENNKEDRITFSMTQELPNYDKNNLEEVNSQTNEIDFFSDFNQESKEENVLTNEDLAEVKAEDLIKQYNLNLEEEEETTEFDLDELK
ncbi:ATP-binding protein [[Mycoplasma] falconis]|uniref:ATP-binding protein n=1 Tax=[Mycoplasma] falconis TaxID=92403 RepID=A0A501X9G9_9BACT|nr:AAA domain-containing protein [[Mycoplasma] falconis]TPE57205.1 ATP-binding protein [[Mycoplasma] falconis]